MSTTEIEHQGACYCGAVTVTVKGPPMASGYCHCRSCRKWQAAPVNAWSIWPSDKVTITGGGTTTSQEGEASRRVSCATCGGGLANHKPNIGLTVVYAMTLAGSGLDYQPAMHIFYAERVMDLADGLPKFIDVPEAFGGSGEAAEEPATSGWRREA